MNSKKLDCGQSCTLCSASVCSGKGKKCDYIHKQYGLNKWVFRLIVITIFLGAIVPFASETICTIWFPEASVGLNTWNQFVSIILGIIATLLSIVSIIMGFKNYEDTLSVQEKYMQALHEISNMAKDLANVKSDVSKMSSMQEKIPVTSPTQPPEVRWEKEPEDVLNSKQESSIQSVDEIKTEK